MFVVHNTLHIHAHAVHSHICILCDKRDKFAYIFVGFLPRWKDSLRPTCLLTIKTYSEDFALAYIFCL